jgi:hypothetical protein
MENITGEQNGMNELAQEYPKDYRKSQRRSFLISYYRKAFEKVYKRSHKYITDTVQRTWYYMDMQEKAIERGEFETVVLLTGKIKECVHILKKYQDECYFRRLNVSNDIKKDMIQRAKDYPFEKLIEIKRNKMSSCPFHEDKTPSFSIKNNKGHCFSCGWSGDTISFLMKKDGLSFGDAVKRLC